jgi:hydrogenase maturation protease
MLCVIGCGNATRSDDGVGVGVARVLQAHLRHAKAPHARVFDAGTGGMDVMFQARGARRLIIVDASRSGSEAGAIFRVPGKELEALPDPGYSLHDFRWQHALAAGRRIFRDDFPTDVTVFLVEAANLNFGMELSAPVAAAARSVVAEILRAIEQYPQAQAPALAQAAAQAQAPTAAPLRADRGNFYLSREFCDAHFPQAASVALLVRGEDVLIVPLAPQSAGGLLLKQRNARGDRVIHAQEFFREHGFAEDFEARMLSVDWNPTSAALVVHGLRKAATAASSCAQLTGAAPPSSVRRAT